MTQQADVLRRPRGSGTVEFYRGRYRARLPGTRKVLDTFDDPADAHRVLDAWHVVAAEASMPATGEETVRSFGVKFLARREREGHRNAKTDRSRWTHHIETAPFADTPLPEVTRPEIREWLRGLRDKLAADDKEKRRISFATRKHCRNLLRAMFSAAIEDEVAGLSVNPVAGVKLRDEGSTEEGWTYLTLDEQRALRGCEAIPEVDLLRELFAIYSGLRQGEQWNLELRDLRHREPNPHVVVRKGSAKGSTKAAKIRHVQLIPPAVEVLERWLVLLPRYAKKNPLGLVFPTPRGARRQKGKLYGFKEHLKAAGITRRVRWHDLRHTCGSSLVAGWWGHRWSLQEVRDLLGHSSIDQTERYAHLVESVVASAASRTTSAITSASTAEGSNAQGAGIAERVTQESNLRPTAPELVDIAYGFRALGGDDGRLLADAARYLRAVANRNRHSRRYAEELARSVLDLQVVALAREVLEAGPLTYASATRLAEAILAGAPAEHRRRAGGTV